MICGVHRLSFASSVAKKVALGFIGNTEAEII
jgi:hypothetical protein